MDFGPWEVFLLLVVLILLFGIGRIQQLGRSTRGSSRGAAKAAPAPVAPPPAPPPPVPTVACANCQALVPATNKFCPACGATMAGAQPEPRGESVAEATEQPPVKLVENTCPSCATVNPPGQPFCGQCGAHLTPAAA